MNNYDLEFNVGDLVEYAGNTSGLIWKHLTVPVKVLEVNTKLKRFVLDLPQDFCKKQAVYANQWWGFDGNACNKWRRVSQPKITRFKHNSEQWAGLLKLQEEMNELSVVISKLVANDGNTEYWDTDLQKDLEDELADVEAALDWFTMRNGKALDNLRIGDRYVDKLNKYSEWAKL